MLKNLNIAQIGHPILRKKSKKISINDIKTGRIQELINKMVDIMHNANGAGLAANQIYEPYSICVIELLNNPRYSHLEDIPLKVLINPKISILNTEDTFNSYEGCLSVPNLRGKVKRYNKIKVEYYDRLGEFKKESLSGLEAIVYQHEIDHLEGILFTDKVYDNSTLVTYDNYIKYHQDGFQEELLEFLKNNK